MSSSLDQQIADLQRKSRRRRDNDVGATMVGVGACVTVLVPWGIGYLTRGWTRTTEPGVFDVDARSAGDYFLTDWSFGCVLVLVALAAFLVLRPWSNRLRSVLFGVAVAAGAGTLLLPYSLNAWQEAEARTAERLLSEPYPFYERYTNCGGRSVTLPSADGVPVTWSLFLGRYTTASSDVRCDHAVLYRGWEKVASIDFPAGSYEPSGGLCCSTDVAANAGATAADSSFLVTFADGVTMTVALGDYQ